MLSDDLGGRPESFASLAERLLVEEGLPAWRRQSLPIHIRSLCRLLDLDPASTPADLAPISERIARFRPQRAGVSKRNWQNILAGVRFALRYTGYSALPDRDRTPLRPAWAALLGQIPEVERHLRFRLARFARWCGCHRQCETDPGRQHESDPPS